jgi:hypothetical protein
MGVAEAHDDHLAAEIGERALAAARIAQVQLAADVAAGDVDALEGTFLGSEPLAAAGARRCSRDQARGDEAPRAHAPASGR